jgi:hypothetical protein
MLPLVVLASSSVQIIGRTGGLDDVLNIVGETALLFLNYWNPLAGFGWFLGIYNRTNLGSS